jgi:hypothetical protein
MADVDFENMSDEEFESYVATNPTEDVEMETTDEPETEVEPEQEEVEVEQEVEETPEETM